jgi:hypothetical protein
VYNIYYNKAISYIKVLLTSFILKLVYFIKEIIKMYLKYIFVKSNLMYKIIIYCNYIYSKLYSNKNKYAFKDKYTQTNIFYTRHALTDILWQIYSVLNKLQKITYIGKR